MEFERSNNPFADYGGIVHGDRFVGRKREMEEVNNRFRHGNLAIIGEPRIGKSSLAYRAIIDRREELINKKFLPIRLNIANYEKSPDLFRSLITECLEEMNILGWTTDPIQKAAESALQNQSSWADGYIKIQNFFGKIRKHGYRILFILDEFDHAQKLFRGDISGFQGLRELSYQPDVKVIFTTVSRRTVMKIEENSGAISTFSGIFKNLNLGMFSSEYVEEYFCRVERVTGNLAEEEKKKISSYCGGHPYLLDMLACGIVDIFNETNQVDVDKAANKSSSEFFEHYDRTMDLLRENDLLKKLLQILFGPVVDVNKSDINELMRYGYIEEKEDGYVAYSPHFQAFLKLIERETDLWPLWRDTEKALRRIITKVCADSYGENWFNELEKRHSTLKNTFNFWKDAQKKEEEKYKERASRNLLDFSYPADMFPVIFAEWKKFESIFGKNKPYWEQRSSLLSKVRNPLAHNRDEVLYEHERHIAEGYCKEILSLIDTYLDKS